MGGIVGERLAGATGLLLSGPAKETSLLRARFVCRKLVNFPPWEALDDARTPQPQRPGWAAPAAMDETKLEALE